MVHGFKAKQPSKGLAGPGCRAEVTVPQGAHGGAAEVFCKQVSLTLPAPSSQSQTPAVSSSTWRLLAPRPTHSGRVQAATAPHSPGMHLSHTGVPQGPPRVLEQEGRRKGKPGAQLSPSTIWGPLGHNMV